MNGPYFEESVFTLAIPELSLYPALDGGPIGDLVFLAGQEIKGAKQDMFSPPGGKKKLGETAKQTAVRETFEETGLEINPDRLSHLLTIPVEFKRDRWASITILKYVLNAYEVISVGHVKLKEYQLPDGPTPRMMRAVRLKSWALNFWNNKNPLINVDFYSLNEMKPKLRSIVVEIIRSVLIDGFNL